MRYILGLNILSLLVFVVFFNFLPPEIPLYYSFPTIEEQLAPLIFIFLPILIADLFIVLNNFLVSKFFPESKDFNILLRNISYFLITSAFYMFIKTIFLVI